MKHLTDFTLDHPTITGLRIVQIAVLILSLLAFMRLGWLPLMVGMLAIIELELAILGMSLVYFLKRFCNTNGK